MRITNWKHFPWFLFVLLATVVSLPPLRGQFSSAADARRDSFAAVADSNSDRASHRGRHAARIGLRRHLAGNFCFRRAAQSSKKIPLWRVGTMQRWLRAHIWLTFLTIPLIILHSGFRLGGPMTTLLMVLYAIVMGSGIYGLVLQHLMPRLMKERLPAETVFEQIPHIRSQLCVAAEKMRDSLKPAPPKKPDAGAPAASPAKTVTAGSAVMASTKGELSTPVARAKSVTGSAVTAEPVAMAMATTTAAPVARAVEASPEAVIPSAANAAASSVPGKPAERSARRARRRRANRPAVQFHATRFRPRILRRTLPLFQQLRRWQLHRKNHRRRLRQNPLRLNPRPLPRNLRPHRIQHRRKRWSNSSIAKFSLIFRQGAARDTVWARRVSRMTHFASLNCASRKPTAAGSKKSRAGATSGACSIYRRVSIIGSTPGFSFMCRFRFCC